MSRVSGGTRSMSRVSGGTRSMVKATDTVLQIPSGGRPRIRYYRYHLEVGHGYHGGDAAS
jgi:hypothetical protein